MKTLILSANKITRIVPGVFGKLKNLQKLHLDSNKLKLIRSATFLGLTNLEELNLEENAIQEIEPAAFWSHFASQKTLLLKKIS
jgi:Leucine-rich repeat (LRR) protein